MSSDYKLLHQQYMIAVARIKDLEEQIATKTEQWEKREEESRIRDKHVAELCDHILSNDKRKLTLGKSKTWAEWKLDKMISEAEDSFMYSLKNQREQLLKVVNDNEKRTTKIHSLQAEMSILKEKMNNSPNAELSKEDLEKEAKKREAEEKAKGRKPPAIESNPAIYFTGEDEDEDLLSEMEQGNRNAAAQNSEKAKPTSSSIPTTDAKKTVKNRREAKKRAQESEQSTHEVELGEYVKKIDALGSVGWMCMQVAGETGISISQELKAEVIKRLPDESVGNVSRKLQQLHSMGMFELKTAYCSSLAPKTNIMYLTVEGIRVYRLHFKSDPVKSEAELIMAEHNNLDHGYSIVFIARAIRKKREFLTVQDRGFRDNPFELNNGKRYMPDIICKDKHTTLYIEYELGNTDPTAFNAKCNKMCMVTETLNFVVPNQKVAEHVRDQVSAWIRNKGAEAVSAYTIRIATVTTVKSEVKLKKNESWDFLFIPRTNGADAIQP